MKYGVQAVMSVVVWCEVEAGSVEEAVVLAKAKADDGTMEELERTGWFDGWWATRFVEADA